MKTLLPSGIIYQIEIEKPVLSGLFTKKKVVIRELFQIEKSDRLGFRATGQRIDGRGSFQISPKWRKTEKTAMKDLDEWLKEL